MTFEQAILILMPFGGLAVIAALVFWQNQREGADPKTQAKKK